MGRGKPGAKQGSSGSRGASGVGGRAKVFFEIGQRDPRQEHGKDAEKFLLFIGMHVMKGTPLPHSTPAGGECRPQATSSSRRDWWSPCETVRSYSCATMLFTRKGLRWELCLCSAALCPAAWEDTPLGWSSV